jgi:hypothetical protein
MLESPLVSQLRFRHFPTRFGLLRYNRLPGSLAEYQHPAYHSTCPVEHYITFLFGHNKMFLVVDN